MSDIYKVHDEIANRYVVQEILGAGNYSHVYKVLDHLHGDVVALKVFKESTDVFKQVQNEFNTVKHLSHSHIARVFDIGVLPDNRYFLKLEYIEGNNLRDLIVQRRISLNKARQLIHDLLDAIAYLHSHKVMHRDIKPNNLITNGHGLVIVDFNISKQVESYASSNVGTPRYMPPEVSIYGWDWTGDLYAAGLILYEMVASSYPFRDGFPPATVDPIDPRDCNAAISDSLAEAILKSIARERENRFQSAEEMLAALEAADWEPASIPSYDIDLSGVHISPEEANKPNYNPYLTRLLTLYSQSTLTNVGTRGLDDFAHATYVETLLDTALKNAILSGTYPLVIITGNAGDGKTAFIQKLEEEVRTSPATRRFESLPSGNGSRFSMSDRTFYTNYDGSQDEGDINNDEVLRRFLQPFAGDSPSLVRDRVHVIAINEGRLIDFLQTYSKDFSFLRTQIVNFFERNMLPEQNTLIVNLNLRSVIAEKSDGFSIFDHMVSRLSTPQLWEKCKDCDIANRCYAKFNADSLNDPSYGPQIVRRLKALFQITHFRQRLHITIRDLRSALAYILFGTDDCDGIHRMLNDPEKRQDYLARFYYNSAFDFGQPYQASQDRLVQLVSEVDPGRVSNPKLDARLAFTLPDELTILPPFDARSDYDRQLLKAEYQRLQQAVLDVGAENIASNQVPEIAQLSRFYHAGLRRKVFFERIDEDWVNMLPYSRFKKFLELMENADPQELEKVRNSLIHAISLSEGIYNLEVGSTFLCLRTSGEPKVTIKSFRRFARDRFTVRVRQINPLDKYIEYVPPALILDDTETQGIQMEINLDLYEMLNRISQGFTPSLNELRGSFINLLIFKHQLASTGYEEVLLTEDEQEFYRVRRVEKVKLELSKFA